MASLSSATCAARTEQERMAHVLASHHGKQGALDRCLVSAALWEAGTDSAIARLRAEDRAERAEHYLSLALAIDAMPDRPTLCVCVCTRPVWEAEEDHRRRLAAD